MGYIYFPDTGAVEFNKPWTLVKIQAVLSNENCRHRSVIIFFINLHSYTHNSIPVYILDMKTRSPIQQTGHKKTTPA